MAETTFYFRAQAITTIVMLLLAPLFIGLGIWQLDRAEQKRNMSSSLEARRKMPVIPLGTQFPGVEEIEYRKVTAEGNFLPEKTVMIENRKHLGKNGFHVITPLQLADGSVVLVNRGWVPPGRSAMRKIVLPEVDTPDGMTVIHGEASIPHQPALQLGEASSEGEGTPHWPYLTLEQYTSWSGLEIMPFVILQSPQQKSGFVRSWPTPPANEMMHLGYAIQWFAFALIMLVIWLRLSLHKKPKAEVL